MPLLNTPGSKGCSSKFKKICIRMAISGEDSIDEIAAKYKISSRSI